MSALGRTISFSFEAVRGEYLSRTQRATQRVAILSILQMEKYGKPYVRRIYIYIGGEPAGSNKTGSPVGSGDTSLISTSAWPPQCIGLAIYGLARSMT